MTMRLLIASAVFALAGMAVPAMAEQPHDDTEYDDVGQFRWYCDLLGGTWSGGDEGTVCCIAEDRGCIVCDSNAKNCDWYPDSHARIDGFSRPQVAAPPGQNGPMLNPGGGGAVFSPSFGN